MLMDKVIYMNLLIPLNEIEEGMVLGDDVFDKAGRLLVSKDTVVSILTRFWDKRSLCKSRKK